jgi:hypothetical protein
VVEVGQGAHKAWVAMLLSGFFPARLEQQLSQRGNLFWEASRRRASASIDSA